MTYRVTYRTPDGGKGCRLVQGRDRRDAIFSFQVAFPAFKVIGVEPLEESSDEGGRE